jgi:hypothetical protein
VNGVACGDLTFEFIEEADEFLVTMTLHVPACRRAVEHVQSGK